jgi:hypothetical protein
MSFFPGWESVESTAAIARALHITAVIVLGLLFVAEGMALIYDFRNHHLAGIAESERVAAQSAKDREADERRKNEVESLQKQLSEAGKKVANLEARQAGRHLSDQQRQTLLAAIKPYPTQRVDLVAVANDGEAISYAQDFLSVFQAAGWNVISGGVAQATFTGDVTGIAVTISAAHGTSGTAPFGAGRFIQAMIQLGLTSEGFNGPEVQGDDVQVRIGRQPPAR